MMDFKVYNEVKNRKLGYNFLEKKKNTWSVESSLVVLVTS